MTPDRLWIALGSVYGFLGVAFGAFGAHALKERLGPDQLGWWRTAVEYQFVHALALLMLGVLAKQFSGSLTTYAGACFAAGILLFSGSLYGLALTGAKIFGPMTPLGGLLFLIGWGCLLLAAIRN